MRIPQPESKKGSQKWIQKLINNNRDLICSSLDLHLASFSYNDIKWLSPLKDDDYSEYRDEEFLNKLGIRELKKNLNEFWPVRGPQWDALGRVSQNGPYFLIEAKANIPEIISDSQAESHSSIALIQKSLNETLDYLKCKRHLDWTKGFYQYANRIVHLYFLREINKIDVYLIFIYFLNDYTHIPTSIPEWHGAILLQKRLLGLSQHKLQKYVFDVFIDTKQIV